jgi:diguanylate cyclase (GGDEF)-like protein
MNLEKLEALKYAEMKVVHRILRRQKSLADDSLLHLDRLLYLQKSISLLSLDEIKTTLIEKLPYILAVRFFSLFLYDKDRKLLSLACHNQPHLPPTLDLHLSEAGVMQDTLHKGSYILEPDFTKSKYYQGKKHPVFQCNFFVSVPLMIESETIGILNLNDNEKGMFSVEDLDFVLSVSEFLSLSLSNALNFAKVESLSISDGLTALYNHQQMLKVLEKETVRSRRYGSPLSLIILDIDFFKKVNDTYGHQKGDEVLIEVGKVLKSVCRENDLAARYGGEEFVLILPETRVQGAFQIAERLRQEVGRLRFPGMERNITASCGVAEFDREKTQTFARLIQTADTALYKAKNSGRNQTVIGQVE